MEKEQKRHKNKKQKRKTNIINNNNINHTDTRRFSKREKKSAKIGQWMKIL